MIDDPLAEPGKEAAIHDRMLLILAADHRDSLERGMYGLTSEPTAAQAARICADKLLIYQALLDAVEHLPAGAQPGILIDEQYGADAIELAGRSGGAVNLTIPIEASGNDWFTFAYGDRWQQHAEFFSADQLKVLVRDNPEFAPARRAQQGEDLAGVSAWATETGRPLILELLVPASESDMQEVGGDRARYDTELRPALTVAVIEYLQDHGVEPAIWKIEGLERHDDAVATVAAVRRDGRQSDCIVLGRHAPHSALDHWLKVAAPVPGFTGFAIGRSIWWDPLQSHLHHRSTAAGARRRISDNYLDLAQYYMRAREGGLEDNWDSESWRMHRFR